MTEDTSLKSLELAVEVTIAWLGAQNNRFTADDVPGFLRTIHATVVDLAGGAMALGAASAGNSAPQSDFIPAVTVKKSLASKNHIVSMINGKPYRSLRRHLSQNGLTPDEYRARYRLKPDYPITSESYSAERRERALRIGLGTIGREAQKAKVPAPAAKPKRGPRAKPTTV